VVDSALTIDALSGAAYGLRARLRIRRGDVRDAWTDIELAARTGARWEALALTTMLKARELGAAAARERLTGELRDALVPVRMLDAERAVALAVALAQVGDSSERRQWTAGFRSFLPIRYSPRCMRAAGMSR
jgi:hypothetical protein